LQEEDAMRRALSTLGALFAPLVLVVGCLHEDVRRDEAALAHLPVDRKQEVFTAQHNLAVAGAHQTAAVEALAEARRWRDFADRDVDAAKARSRAAGPPESRCAVERSLAVADHQLQAARSRRAYADKLIDLRRAELELADRYIDVAQAELALARIDALNRSGIVSHEGATDSQYRRDNGTRDVISVERRVAALQDQATTLRMAWQEQQRSYDVASRELVAPLPPQ
jgi:hypothetical protein